MFRNLLSNTDRQTARGFVECIMRGRSVTVTLLGIARMARSACTVRTLLLLLLLLSTEDNSILPLTAQHAEAR